MAWQTTAFPAALAGSRYIRLAMKHSGQCRLLVRSDRYLERWLPSLRESACPAFLCPAPRDRATAEYRRRTRQAVVSMARIARSHDPKAQPAAARWRAISMIVFSSLGSLFERCINAEGTYQIRFTQNSCRGDSGFCRGRKRDRRPSDRRVVMCPPSAGFPPLLARICGAGAVFAEPAHASGGEVSIAQVTPGMTLRFKRRQQPIAATHPHSVADSTHPHS